MAALDDMVGVAVFLTTVAIVARNVSGTAMPVWRIPVMILLPLVIGVLTGIPTGFLLKKKRGKAATLSILIGMILVTAGIGFVCSTCLTPSPVLSFMLMGSIPWAIPFGQAQIDVMKNQAQRFYNGTTI